MNFAVDQCEAEWGTLGGRLLLEVDGVGREAVHRADRHRSAGVPAAIRTADSPRVVLGRPPADILPSFALRSRAEEQGILDVRDVRVGLPQVQPGESRTIDAGTARVLRNMYSTDASAEVAARRVPENADMGRPRAG